MNDQEILDRAERAARSVAGPDDAYEALLRRRDRKRRNQRIAAGVVGMAVFVAAVLIVGTIGLPDRTQGPAGGGETGPAVTGPTTAPDGGWDGHGPPPEGAVPSDPAEGELVERAGGALGVSAVFVYDDGRLLVVSRGTVTERRLTPEAVELVRSGVISEGDLTPPWSGLASAWADAEPRPYVPYRYAICLEGIGPNGGTQSQILRLFPSEAGRLLDGKERMFDDAGPHDSVCFEVTTADARNLSGILDHAGFRFTEGFAGGYEWLARAGVDPSLFLSAEFLPILPHGTFAESHPPG